MTDNNPHYNRERKTWGLRKARIPQAGFDLSGVVKCTDLGGAGHIYIGFDASFVDAVAKVLPQGIGPENQAYLYVSQKQFGTMRYYVYARYLDKTKNYLLWIEKQKPDWFSKLKRGSTDGAESTAEERTRTE